MLEFHRVQSFFSMLCLIYINDLMRLSSNPNYIATLKTEPNMVLIYCEIIATVSHIMHDVSITNSGSFSQVLALKI